MWLDRVNNSLKNWRPCCEQAKFLAQSSRIAGAAYTAYVGQYLLHQYLTGQATVLQQALLLIVLIEWGFFEYVGYLLIGKGGC